MIYIFPHLYETPPLSYGKYLIASILSFCYARARHTVLITMASQYAPRHGKEEILPNSALFFSKNFLVLFSY